MTSKLAILAFAAVIAIPAAASAQQNQANPAPAEIIWNAENVTKAKPFGDMDMAPVMAANADLAGWAGKLNAQQRAEITGRCGFITGNKQDFDPAALGFCSTYSTWDVANPMAR